MIWSDIMVSLIKWINFGEWNTTRKIYHSFLEIIGLPRNIYKLVAKLKTFFRTKCRTRTWTRFF